MHVETGEEGSADYADGGFGEVGGRVPTCIFGRALPHCPRGASTVCRTLIVRGNQVRERASGGTGTKSGTTKSTESTESRESGNRGNRGIEGIEGIENARAVWHLALMQCSHFAAE